MPGKQIQVLAWVDLETTGLPVPDRERGVMDFSNLHLLEVAILVTDLDLDPIAGYHEVVKMTPEAAQALRENEYVRNMHTTSGLIRDCVKSDTALDLAGIDAEIDRMLKEQTSFDKGEFGLAGSGVARFDHPIIDVKMPLLSSWLHYAEIDMGDVRRAATLFNHGMPVVNPVPESSRDGVKTHRAWDDVKAHIKEGTRYRDFFRKAVALVG